MPPRDPFDVLRTSGRPDAERDGHRRRRASPRARRVAVPARRRATGGDAPRRDRLHARPGPGVVPAAVARAATRPRVVYESHGLAPVVSAELPPLLGNPSLAPSPAKLRRLDRRERRVWTHAPRLRHDHARAGRRAGRPVRPAARRLRRRRRRGAARGLRPRRDATMPRRSVAGYAGHLYPWKGVDVLVRALARTPDIRGLIVGGHPARPIARGRGAGVHARHHRPRDDHRAGPAARGAVPIWRTPRSWCCRTPRRRFPSATRRR